MATASASAHAGSSPSSFSATTSKARMPPP